MANLSSFCPSQYPYLLLTIGEIPVSYDPTIINCAARNIVRIGRATQIMRKCLRGIFVVEMVGGRCRRVSLSRQNDAICFPLEERWKY